MPDWDYLILNGIVVDGTGAPARVADTAVHDDQVVAVSPPGTLDAGEHPPGGIIDATGLVVSPGFVDIHTHTDMTLFLSAELDSKIRQGVTTEVVGNCSIGLSPLTEEALDEYRGWWSWVDRWHRLAGCPWKPRPCWSEYMKMIDARPLRTNIAHLVPHGPLRASVVPDHHRPASEEQLAVMIRMLEEALEEGAFGFSTGLTYMPGRTAGLQELVELVRVVARRGGLYATHVRGEDHRLPAAVHEAITSSRALGGDTGLRLQISHLKAMRRENWGLTDRALRLIEEARSQDLDAMADAYPYTITGTFPVPISTLQTSDLNPELVVVVDPGEASALEPGETLAGVARGLSESLEATTLFLKRSQAWVKMVTLSEEEVARVLAHPLVCIGSDSYAMNASPPFTTTWLHPRNFGTFPRFLSEYVRNRRLIALETAIQKLTSMPASRLGLRDRGVLAPGKTADIAIIDYQNLTDASSTYSPFSYPRGVEYVFVNGQLAVEKGRVTERFAGRLLRA